ncbi:hypothetical protein THOG05_40188 [Vibrio rotiferianus]|nr:hypothetical protein THOG05_40188 [Vibrio rotiferianus]
MCGGGVTMNANCRKLVRLVLVLQTVALSFTKLITPSSERGKLVLLMASVVTLLA